MKELEVWRVPEKSGGYVRVRVPETSPKLRIPEIYINYFISKI